ncbi:MAG: metallophosphoesterase [Myxococcales bacterium]|nr:metallophosphoesterase [Myxococcales bacterium]
MSAPARWLAIGDPQTTLERLLAVLEFNGALTSSGELRPDVGLISMGDHFDYRVENEAERAACAREGSDVLRWLAAHPRSQVRILAGNHDLVRVQELHAVSDAEFLAIRRDQLGPEALRERFPTIADWRSCERDFGSFRAEQRALVQGLLVAGRLDLALCAVVDGAPALFTHAGVTRRELELLGVEEAAPRGLTQALREFFVGRIDAVRERWARGERAPLDLSPLHRTSEVGAEAGGMLAHRPANPDRPDVDKPWEFSAERPRRLDPRRLPRGLTQVVGHTQHHKLKQELLPWVDPRTHAAAHGLRSLVVDDAVRYVPGVAIAGEGEAALVCTDFALHRAPGPDLELLEVERVLS